MGSLRDWRVRSFLGAEAVSGIGTWATLIAIWGYAAYEFDATAGEVSLFGVALTLPAVVLGPLVGATIDRWGPQATLLGAKLAGVAASLALLLAEDFRTLALLSFVHGAVWAFTQPALQALPPRIVQAQDLARTNALVSLTDEFAIVAGPVVGAIAIGTVGFRGAFVVDALTYALGVVVLPLVRVRPLAAAVDTVRLRDALAGLHLVRRTPILRRTVIAMSSVHVLYGAALLAEPLYVRDVLERSPTVFAALQTVFGICLVGSGILVARAGERLASFGWVAFGASASGVTAVIYLGTPLITVAFGGVALWGLCTALLSGPSRTLLQRHAPEALHGRVLATDFVSTSAAQLLGIGVTGVLVANLGVPAAMGVLGSAVALVGVALHRQQRREIVVAPAVVG